MTETEFCEALREAVQSTDEPLGEHVSNISTFKEYGVLTRNEGLVVKLSDGSEFHVTIVRAW